MQAMVCWDGSPGLFGELLGGFWGFLKGYSCLLGGCREPRRLGRFSGLSGTVFGASWDLFWASQGSGVSWEPLGSPGGFSEASRGLLLPLLGPSWACSGAVWGCPGRLLGSPGAFLTRLGAVLGGSWAVLARSWGPLRPSWSVGSTNCEKGKKQRKDNENYRF